MIRKFSAVFFLLFSLLTLTSCTSGKKVAERNLEKYKKQIEELNEELIDEIVEVTTKETNNANYENLIKEMLRNLKIEIVSVEKDEKSDGKEVVAEIQLTTQKNDLLIDNFFNIIIQKSTDSVLSGEVIDKSELFDEGIKHMYETYKNSIDSLPKETNSVKIIYERNEKNKWEMKTPATFYNAILGDLFSKINKFNEDDLPELVLDNFLHNLKAIKIEDVKIFLQLDENISNDLLEFPVMFYNTMDYKIESKTKKDNYTEFKTKINILDERLYFKYVVDQYVAFFKQANDNKKTPTIREGEVRLKEIFLESFEYNKANKKVKEVVINVTDNLEIENIDVLMAALLNDILLESEKAGEEIATRISNIYE